MTMGNLESKQAWLFEAWLNAQHLLHEVVQPNTCWCRSFLLSGLQLQLRHRRHRCLATRPMVRLAYMLTPGK